MTIKEILRAITPPVIISAYKFFKQQPKPDNMWSGNYASWQQAQAQCGGYDDAIILEKCKTALVKIKNGKAAYERDSVTFDKKQYSWPVLAALQNCAMQGNGLHVLDFGGSLGSTYFQNKDLLAPVKNLSWNIVEQPNFVACGKANFEGPELKFYNTPEEAAAVTKPNVLLLSSVLQYLEDPHKQIEEFLALNVPNIIIDRTTFITGDQSLLTVQNVPREIYKASYPCWFFNEPHFLAAFDKSYELIGDFGSYADPNRVSDDGREMLWKGYFFKKKDQC